MMAILISLIAALVYIAAVVFCIALVRAGSRPTPSPVPVRTREDIP